ncbi:uncharacterized protein CTHT_0070500 [Thermochaetoides thermophila DSM 1495]|uniref:Uncharacterized protein n=1 Tax=Chaetomium thermophilum (strain DSM 1495 / CBS 144.50 / IMI 039719) TaxID=759272 RepID=G0SHL9_CHATD|nr:hypothetical protein CTHT_0070500 [Thermochaetoides thermophila DSM 1495]EGS17708.1 hypothetical protein CTHT_0070500 [Thermochaetoides thermophila DSM 1495]
MEGTDGQPKRQREIPKFASFQPKSEPKSDSKVEKVSGSEKERGRSSASREESKRHRDDGRRRDNRSRSRNRDRDRDRVRDWSRERDRERERDRNRDRDRDRDRSRDRDRNRDREREKIRHRDRARSRERDASRERHHNRERDRNRDRDHNNPRDPRFEPNDLYTIDTKGDPLILQYGYNDPAKVPHYRRRNGRVLGSDGWLIWHDDTFPPTFSIVERRPGSEDAVPVLRDKTLMSAAKRIRARSIKPPEGEEGARVDFGADFYPSGIGEGKGEGKGKGKGKGREDRERETSPGLLPEYRSVYTLKPKDKQPSPDSDSSGSGSDSEAEQDLPLPETTLRARNLSHSLLSHIKSNPSDIPSYLALISLQPHLPPFSSKSALTLPESKALASLRLDLYQQALQHCPRDAPERERLLLGMLREGGKLWEPTVTREKWKKVVEENGGFGVWRGWVDWEIGRVGGWGVEEGREVVAKRLREVEDRLAASLYSVEGAVREEDVDALCDEAVYIFLRLTRLLHDGGYTELAVAAWQAVLETVFNRPAGLINAARDAALDEFASFWESEVPRIGEDGAKGWRAWLEAGGDDELPLPEPTATSPQAVHPKRTGDPILDWAALELSAASKTRLPARTLDEGTDDDPFRVVMFSDLRDLLIWFPYPRTAARHPQADGCVSCVLGQWHDLEHNRPGLINEEEEDVSRKKPQFRQQGGGMTMSQAVLFSDGETWFRYLDAWSAVFRERDSQVDAGWVRRTLRHVVTAGGVEGLAEYYLALEWVNEPAGARRVAKGLLRQYSGNLRLYTAYAMVEWVNGNGEVAEKVLASATRLVQPSTRGAQLLWNTWAWMYLSSGQKDTALARLCSSVDRSSDTILTVSPALLLRARSHFSATRDYALSSHDTETATLYAESLMLLEYMSSEGSEATTSEKQGNLAAALESVHAFSKELNSRGQGKSSHFQCLLQSAARLAYYHATHGPYRPATLRAQLQSLLSLSPQNTILLTLFAWSFQSTFSLHDPVREHLDSITSRRLHKLLDSAEPNNNTPDQALGDDSDTALTLQTLRFTISHAARRPGPTFHAVRAAFEAALSTTEDPHSSFVEDITAHQYIYTSPPPIHTPDLWLQYLRLVARHAEQELRRRNLSCKSRHGKSNTKEDKRKGGR